MISQSPAIAGITLLPISSIERMVVGVVHPRLLALKQQVPDAQLPLEVLEAVRQLVGRAGHDQSFSTFSS